MPDSYYNPDGRLLPVMYTFPVDDATRDVVYAASVYTHMLPENAGHYFAAAVRVLRSGGRCVFSFLLLERHLAVAEHCFEFGIPSFALDRSLTR